MEERRLSRKERKRLRKQKPDDTPMAVVAQHSEEAGGNYWVGIQQTPWAHEAKNIIKEEEEITSLHHLDKSEAERLASKIDTLAREIQKRGPQS